MDTCASNFDYSMNEIAITSLADSFFSAIENTDLAAMDIIYSPDAVVWHNHDNVAQPRAENIAHIAALRDRFPKFKYCDIRRRFFEGGFTQQHVLRGTTSDGFPFAIFACMIVEVRDGKITRIDEYLDTAQVPDLRP